MMMGPAKRYGIMPISDDLLYTFGTVAHPAGDYIRPDDWPTRMRAAFAEFAAPIAPFRDQIAVILPRALHAAPDLPGALALFGDLRAPVCRFVQEASRAVGEAGGREDVTDLRARNAALARTAQGAVDGFYDKLNALNAVAEARLGALGA